MKTLQRAPKNGNGASEHAKLGSRKQLIDRSVEMVTRTEAARTATRASRGGRSLEVEIAPIETDVIKLEIVGLSPLIVHRFGHKMRQQILDKQMGKAKSGRTNKDPFADFVESLHIIPGARLPKKKLKPGEAWPFKPNTFGFPVVGFKAAMISACTFTGVAKTIVRGAVHLLGDLAPLKYKRLVCREDVVRVGPFGRRVADIRFRGEFHDWSTTLTIRFNRRVINASQIANLLEHAGFSVGVGEWRPGKGDTGSYGSFAIKR